MRKVFAWTLTWGAVAGLLIQAPRIAFAQQAPVVTIDECRALDDADVHGRIRELATTSFKTELTAIDYPALVNKHWAKADVGARIDREVDAAIAAVRADFELGRPGLFHREQDGGRPLRSRRRRQDL